MKQSSRDRNAADLFRPTKFSGDGFMGSDMRSVEAIIVADAAVVETLGTTCEAIAAGLATIFDKAESALGEPVELKPGVVATHYEARGKIPSPFRGDGVFQKGEVAITGTTTKKTLYLTRLGINMINRHGFFQGKESRYRIEPENAAEVAGLTNQLS